MSDPTDEGCFTCAEGGYPTGECPNGKRPCKHHCNCSWDMDVCHWCGAEMGEEIHEPSAADRRVSEGAQP